RMFARRKKPTYWDYSVNCSGTEAHLSSCRLGQLTPPQQTPPAPAASPWCSFSVSAPQQPLVRLRGGAIVGEGRVEVLKNGEWGTICDDRWDLLSATVVCRELGFGTAKEALSGGRLGQGRRAFKEFPVPIPLETRRAPAELLSSGRNGPGPHERGALLRVREVRHRVSVQQGGSGLQPRGGRGGALQRSRHGLPGDAVVLVRTAPERRQEPLRGPGGGPGGQERLAGVGDGVQRRLGHHGGHGGLPAAGPGSPATPSR
ncbi:unnamed protein product, partial [Tetraodon nigroviridis]